MSDAASRATLPDAIAFSGNRLRRLSEKRSETCVADALADTRTTAMVIRDGRAVIEFAGNKRRALFDLAKAERLGGKRDSAVLLGFDGNAPVLAMAGDTPPDDLPEPFKAVDFRSVYMQGLLGGHELGALAQGAALLSWHATHRFCSRCGAESRMADGGYKRVCPSCNGLHFPRTDPVAIMLAVRGERCLLGRSPHFAPNMYSCLAGFIEPGETIEDAVRRETFEEAGVRLGRVDYLASQPWPFPHSLMIGCLGEALSEEIVLDDELEDARWFSRNEVAEMLLRRPDQGLRTPPRGAIAHFLIDQWVHG